ncbi:SRPBCC domain-containing protein [Motilibacter deserti]|uniref:SRPBCC domain-containing protein n=1 Tax=Motilibacter deserti TaxID=2714956 RepID=UPI001E5FA66E|nr:SRPBCC domain-containing protein [Motilibacter deserti]
MPRVDSASRMIHAPQHDVYAALVDPALLVRWLPPHGMTGRFEHFDARAGGSYRLVLTYSTTPSTGGKTTSDSDVVHARFLALEPPERVVQAVDFESADEAFAGTMRMTWELRASSGATLVAIRAEDVPAGITPEDHAAGMQASLANLARLLEEQAPARLAVADKRNVHDVLDGVAELWSPHVVGEVNDYDVKAANVEGDYAEHVHEDTDEVFLVLTGRLHLDLPDRTVSLGPMDVFTVPRGVRHRPRAEPGTRIVNVEPRGTTQDGTATGTTGHRLG